MTDQAAMKARRRIMQFLRNAGSVTLHEFGGGEENQLILKSESASNSRIICLRPVLNGLQKSGLISVHNTTAELTSVGSKWLERASSSTHIDPQTAYQNQHRHLERQSVKINGENHCVVVNGNESPLYRLRNRKTKSGQPWINDAAFAAGERLRADFTFGQSMQRTTSNWEAYSTPINKSFHGEGRHQVSDSAMDARARVEKAMDYVGPELASVLTDVCCFLKGLETVERERRWPPRSAKLMLRTGLELLARYYGTASGTKRSFGDICSWGDEGYRPEIMHS